MFLLFWVFLDWFENGFGSVLSEILQRPTIVDVLNEFMMLIVPLWVVVFVGVLVGWAWKPKWTNVCPKILFQLHQLPQHNPHVLHLLQFQA